MTDINTTLTTASTTQTASPEAGSITADFEFFLEMLTTQLKYQDPMDPMESTEFAVQLATFSGVEQQVVGNDLLRGMSSQMATSNMAEVAGWIGKEVRAQTPAYFDGSPITISPNPAAISDEAELVVLDEAGNEIIRTEIPVSAEPIEWAGVSEDGSPLPEGIYQFEVVSYAEGEVKLRETAEVYVEVVEVRSQGDSNILMIEGGIGVPASSVSAIRVP